MLGYNDQEDNSLASKSLLSFREETKSLSQYSRRVILDEYAQ